MGQAAEVVFRTNQLMYFLIQEYSLLLLVSVGALAVKIIFFSVKKAEEPNLTEQEKEDIEEENESINPDTEEKFLPQEFYRLVIHFAKNEKIENENLRKAIYEKFLEIAKIYSSLNSENLLLDYRYEFQKLLAAI
jgi:hypothetical protein